MPPIALYLTKQLKACVEDAITTLPIPPSVLVKRTGQAALKALQTIFPLAKNLAIYCGDGKNANLGYTLASLASEVGYIVKVNHYDVFKRLLNDASTSKIDYCHLLKSTTDSNADVIIDALVGVDNTRLSESISVAIKHINDRKIPVLSLSIPAGLNADTGQIKTVAIKATATLAFIGYTLGMLTLDGPDTCGTIYCDDLGLNDILLSFKPVAYVLDKHLPAQYLTKRYKNCHKNDFGHVLIIGGNQGMPGAVCLSATAAFRVGAGMVTIATKPNYAKAALSGLPEAMIYGINDENDLLPLLKKATVCIVGPGLGNDWWALQVLSQAIKASCPLVVDASALRLLASSPSYHPNWILTPHPGEAASLLSCTIGAIEQDRYDAVTRLQAKFGGNIVLKGVGSLVCTDTLATYLCQAGNPGMASAGMGDVLSGVIGGLCAQRVSSAHAAQLGVLLHAQAADLAVAKLGERGLIASDLMPYLRYLANKE